MLLFRGCRRFLRSEYAERVDKSPTELLTGKWHMHWLEMLGFQLFKKPIISQKVEENSKVGCQSLVKVRPSEELPSLVEKLKKAA